MSNWMLTCISCKLAFAHSMTVDADSEDLSALKRPNLPASGIEFECPHCGHRGIYRQEDFWCSPPYELVGEQSDRSN
jgi:predicted RNA-binding Zn-ribbon protein involved in translation (DUF1610 family)